MPAEKATALVLRVIDFSESSCIVTLFTREFGKIGALAKGGRRPKGPFESALDLLAICRVVFLRKSSDVLDLLTEAKLERRFRPPGRSLAALYAGYYIAELVNELTDQYDPHPDLFDLCANTLESISEGGDPASEVLRFELRSLRILGHQPALKECAECGARPAAGARLAFGLLHGGMLCEACRVGKRPIVQLSHDAWQLLWEAGRGRRESSRNQEESPADVPSRKGYGEARAVMNQYLNHLVGHRLKMHEML